MGHQHTNTSFLLLVQPLCQIVEPIVATSQNACPPLLYYCPILTKTHSNGVGIASKWRGSNVLYTFWMLKGLPWAQEPMGKEDEWLNEWIIKNKYCFVPLHYYFIF